MTLTYSNSDWKDPQKLLQNYLNFSKKILINFLLPDGPSTVASTRKNRKSARHRITGNGTSPSISHFYDNHEYEVPLKSTYFTSINSF